MDSIVNLNVGGTVYTTSLLTLNKYPDSMLSRMFNGNIPSAQDESGNYVIDRDGQLFRFILTFLRSSNSKLVLPQDFTELEMLLEEAEFYQIPPLIEKIKELMLPKKYDFTGKQAFMLNVGGTVFSVHRKYLEPTKVTFSSLKNSEFYDVEFVKLAIWKQCKSKTRDQQQFVMGNLWETINKTDCPRDKDGNFIIDCIPDNFQYILNFIRSGNFGLPNDISVNQMFCLRDDLHKLDMNVLEQVLPLERAAYPEVEEPDFEFLDHTGVFDYNDYANMMMD